MLERNRLEKSLEITGTVRQVLMPDGMIVKKSVHVVRLMIAYNVLSTLNYYFSAAMKQPRCKTKRDHFRTGDQVVFLPFICGAIKEAYDCYMDLREDIGVVLRNCPEANDVSEKRTEFEDIMGSRANNEGLYRRIVKHMRDKAGAHLDKEAIKKCLRYEVKSTRDEVFAVTCSAREDDGISLRYPYADLVHNAVCWSYKRTDGTVMDRNELESVVSDIARAAGMFMAIADVYIGCKLKESACFPG